MKLLFLLMFICPLAIRALSKNENEDLTELAKQLYEVEDKLDHLLYHFNHDVTRHSYKRTRYGTMVRAEPKNPNSIHQKLKLIDNMNSNLGHPNDWHTGVDNNAYNMALGGPAMAMPISGQ